MIPATAPAVTALPDVEVMRCAHGMTGNDNRGHHDAHDVSEDGDESASGTGPASDGVGRDGTIPDDPEGIAAGHTGSASTFEPEEDEPADEP